jgi:hypothetical protein
LFQEDILKLVEIEKVAPLWNNPQYWVNTNQGATNESKHEREKKSNTEF